MFEFIQETEPFVQVMWYLALTTTLVFLIQTIMVFIGGDMDAEVDTDLEVDLEIDDPNVDHAQQDTGATFQWFSLKNLITFLMFFAWSIISADMQGLSKPISALIGVGSGLVMVAIMTSLYYFMKTLQLHNVPTMTSIIGSSANVYLRIPDKGTGMGKITLSVNGALQTIDAIALDKGCPTSSQVIVKGLKDGRIAIVTLDE